MAPELRKRKAPATEPAAAPPAKKGPVSKAVATTKKVVAKATTSNGSSSVSKIAVGDTITLDGFGGEIETHTGEKTTLKKLVDDSVAGVVLFTYPAASTPGCTKQACYFRDDYSDLTSTGFSIYGLSKDSPKANTNFKEKQKLTYTLLCDPKFTLISAIGLKKTPSGTIRGVFVVDKSGKVLLAEGGSPIGTVEAVKKLLKAAPADGASKEPPAAIKAGPAAA
ncbi:thioredoxin-like protein [Bisporella sp. PMI_857]|nr:thioredoxin-like protein [Bisporella sp. PMI_857]